MNPPTAATAVRTLVRLFDGTTRIFRRRATWNFWRHDGVIPETIPSRSEENANGMNDRSKLHSRSMVMSTSMLQAFSERHTA